MFQETFNPYRPSVIAWPALGPDELRRLQSLPIWDIAVQTEGRARLSFAAYADGLEDAEFRRAIMLNAWEENRHKEVLSHLVSAYGIALEGYSYPYPVQYLPLEGTGRQCVITGRLGRVALNPTPYEAARRFFIRGIAHVPGATDYLLLLICLVVPFRSVRGLAPMVIALTAGHSATLIGTAFNLAQVGQVFAPVVDVAIAASIAYVALQNIGGAALDRRWLIAGVSGLVYGLGLSYLLRQELQLAGSHPLLSVLSFNLGIEIAQLMTLAVVFGSVSLLLRGPIGERTGIVVISAIVAHTAWHWTIDRGTVLWQAGWPELDAPSLLILARWMAGALVAISAVRLLVQFRARQHA